MRRAFRLSASLFLAVVATAIVASGFEGASSAATSVTRLWHPANVGGWSLTVVAPAVTVSENCPEIWFDLRD